MKTLCFYFTKLIISISSDCHGISTRCMDTLVKSPLFCFVANVTYCQMVRFFCCSFRFVSIIELSTKCFDKRHIFLGIMIEAKMIRNICWNWFRFTQQSKSKHEIIFLFARYIFHKLWSLWIIDEEDMHLTWLLLLGIL